MDFKEIESKFQATEDSKSAESENGMVATAFPDATNAGVEMLKQGGNAVDAACAAALALCVCEPQSSGIGGQTMMLISLREKVLAIDGSSRAPSLAHVSGIYKGDRSYGYRATTVPSTPATLWYVNKHYGKLSWKKVLEPAICLAEQGYTITPLQHRLQKQELVNFDTVESGSGKRYFLKDGVPYTPGERFYQPDLAKMLRILAFRGVEEFYQGTIAKQIVPWATVAPTLIFRNKEEIWLAVGSPGSERIFSCIAQLLIHVVDENQPIDEAMRAPRLHCSLGGRVSLEAERFSDLLITFFQDKRYRIDKREPYSFYLGAIHAVLKKHDGTGFQGVAEVRRDGTAGGC